MKLLNKFGEWSMSDAFINTVLVLASVYVAVGLFVAVAS